MPYLRVHEIDLHYEEHGEGPALVLAHGAGGNQLVSWQQVPEFARDYRVITFDHRAFGRSHDVERGPGRRAFPLDLHALLDHLGRRGVRHRRALHGRAHGDALPVALPGPTAGAGAVRHDRRSLDGRGAGDPDGARGSGGGAEPALAGAAGERGAGGSASSASVPRHQPAQPPAAAAVPGGVAGPGAMEGVDAAAAGASRAAGALHGRGARYDRARGGHASRPPGAAGQPFRGDRERGPTRPTSSSRRPTTMPCGSSCTRSSRPRSAGPAGDPACRRSRVQ